MMMRLLLMLFVQLCASVAAARPSPEAFTAEVADNVAVEYAECAAYFTVVQGGFEHCGKAAEAAKYKEISDKAMNFSLLAAKQGRTEEMATKVTLARFEGSLKEMTKEIDYSYSNIAILMNRYSNPCVDAMTDSAPLIKRWTEKIGAKYGMPIDNK